MAILSSSRAGGINLDPKRAMYVAFSVLIGWSTGQLKNVSFTDPYSQLPHPPHAYPPHLQYGLPQPYTHHLPHYGPPTEQQAHLNYAYGQPWLHPSHNWSQDRSSGQNLRILGMAGGAARSSQPSGEAENTPRAMGKQSYIS